MSDFQEKIYQAFHKDIEGIDFPEADKLKEEFQNLQPLGEEEKDGIKNYEEAFLVRFAYESNAIEGSTLTLGETGLVLEGEFVPSEDKKLADIFAAKGCADGYAYIKRALSENRPLTEDFIKDIQERTALDCQPRVRGTYRFSPAMIVGSRTAPADALEIRSLVPSLIYMYENSEAHPIAKAAAFHAMFENIHPFSDGNGRTGRLILNYMLEQSGYQPIAIKHNAKADYKSSLEAWQVKGDPSSFINIVKEYVESELSEQITIVEKTREAIKILEPERLESRVKAAKEVSKGSLDHPIEEKFKD